MQGSQSPPNEHLAEALRSRRPRFFRAARGAASGKSGPEDTARFAENLIVLQECALLIGEKLGMSAVTHAVLYEGEETAGFCFDPSTNPQAPDVAGAIVNRRMPVRDFLRSLRDSTRS